MRIVIVGDLATVRDSMRALCKIPQD